MTRSLTHGHHAGDAPGVIYDASGGVVRRVHLEGDRVIYSSTTPASVNQAILDYAHEMRCANDQHRLSPKTRPIGRHAGVIPLPMYYRWLREYEEKHKPYGIDEQDFLAKKLNSSEFSALRTLRSV